MGSYIVTGGAGFIGLHTANALLQMGHKVWILDNFRTGSREKVERLAAHSDARFVELDIRETDELATVVGKIEPDGIVHLAALVSVQESVENPRENFSLNVAGTESVAEAALKCEVPRIVFASSAAVYGRVDRLPVSENNPTRPISPYGAAKLAAEDLLLGYTETFGIRVACLRYFNVYGPGQSPDSAYSGVISKFAEAFRTNSPFRVFGDGLQTRDFVHVRDVAAANAGLVSRQEPLSGVFNVCSGRETSLLDLISCLRDIHGGGPTPEFAPARLGDIIKSVGDERRLLQASGFKPSVPIKEGLSDLVNSLRASSQEH
jgi:UDP-glucose 4-epimerase